MPGFDELTIGYGYKEYIEKLKKNEAFANLASYAEKLQKLITKYTSPDPNQGNTIPAVDEEAKQQLLFAYEKLSTEISELKKNSKSLLTSEDELKLLDSIESAVSGDTHSLLNYNPALGYVNLPYIFETSKSIKVDVSDKALGKVGGAQSSRIPFKYIAPDGKRYDGFFTESKIFDPAKIIQHKIDSLSDKPDLQNFLKCCAELATERALEALNNPNPTEREKYFIGYMSKDILSRIAKGENVPPEEFVPSALAFYFSSGLVRHNGRLTLTEQRMNKLIYSMRLKDRNPAMLKALTYLETNENKDELDDLKCFIAENVNMISLHFYSELEAGSRIDSRNAAMSSVASLLGKPNLIAKAIPMSIIRDGKEIKGCFMSNAEGIDPNHRTAENKDIKASSMDYSPALASLADLQVIDYICGNTDRHGGNLVYQYNEKTGKMQSVIGIDNDLSFGTYVPENDGSSILSMVPLNHMRAMTESMAQKIEALTKEQLMQALKPYDLKDDQMEACWKRTQMVKNKIAEGREAYKDERGKSFHTNKLRIIPDKEFETYDRSFLQSNYSNKANIFGHPKRLDNAYVDMNMQKRTSVTRAVHIFDANAARSYGKDGVKAVERMTAATNSRGSSPEFENLKEAIAVYADFHAKHTGAMMTDGDILQHDTMIYKIETLANVYLEHYENKLVKSGYADKRAELVREIKNEFSTKNISSKLTKEDRELIHRQDEKNFNALNSSLRAAAQMDVMKAVLLKDAQQLKKLAACGSQEAFEAAVKNQIFHAAIANKYCNDNMQIKLSDFSKVMKIMNEPGDNLQKIENTDYFKEIKQKSVFEEYRKLYAEDIANRFILKENATMEKPNELQDQQADIEFTV